MQIRLLIPMMMLMLLGAQADAKDLFKGRSLATSHNSMSEEKKWYYPFEIGELNIKQSNDGSGIIKQVSCSGCDYQFVKITPDTLVFVNGIKVELLRARERAGQQAYIEFDKETAEVKHIYWSE